MPLMTKSYSEWTADFKNAKTAEEAAKVIVGLTRDLQQAHKGYYKVERTVPELFVEAGISLEISGAQGFDKWPSVARERGIVTAFKKAPPPPVTTPPKPSLFAGFLVKLHLRKPASAKPAAKPIPHVDITKEFQAAALAARMLGIANDSAPVPFHPVGVYDPSQLA